MNNLYSNTTENNKTSNVKLPSFYNFVQPEHDADSLDNLIGTLSDHGLSTIASPEEMFDWASEEDAISDASELAMHMQHWGKWLEAKVKGYEALRDIGRHCIYSTAGKSGTVSVKVGGVEVSGDWCRYDNVIYVFYGDAVEAGPVHTHGTKSTRNEADLSSAKFMLETLYKHTAQGYAA